MARPRTPTNVLEMRGSFDKNPQRRSDREGAPIVKKPLGTVAAHLTLEQKKCWKEIAKITPKGVLTEADRITVELAACLLAEFREDPAGFSGAKLARLEAITGKMGLNPSDRTKINIGTEKKEKDPWADL